MDKLIDRISDKISQISDEPQLLYIPLLRLQQIMSLWVVLTLVPVLRFAEFEFPIFLILAGISIFTSQVALQAMRTARRNRATAFLLAAVVGLVVSPLSGFLLTLFMFSPWFSSQIQGAEPRWYLKLTGWAKGGS